jgi:hypothetical protein
MSSRVAKLVLVYGGVMVLVGILALVSRFVELSPWVWAGCLAAAGLGALGLFLADRSNGLLLLEAYVLWAIAGLVALVPSEILRDEAVAIYVLSAIALPFVGAYVRNRAWWWSLLPAYALLLVVGIIGLAVSGLVSDDLITAFVVLAVALPFFVVYARDRRRWWALIPGGILAALGLSLATWLPWHSIQLAVVEDVTDYATGLGLLVVGAALLARGFRQRAPAGQ